MRAIWPPARTPPPEQAAAYFPLATGWKWAYEIEKGGEKILATYAVVEQMGDTVIVQAGEERTGYAILPEGIARREGLSPGDFILKTPIRAGATWPLGSGTASVIAVASALADLAEKPKRTIVFIALFGEELGGLGSRWYTGHPIFPIARTVADINLEQLGRTDDSEGPKVSQFNLTGFDYSDIAAAFAKAGALTGVQAIKHEKNSDTFFGRSDNVFFADAGIPSTTLSVSYIFPDYHQPGDKWQKLDYDNLAKVDVTVALGVFDMANSAEAPQWNKANPKTARYVSVREKQ